jgi:ATP-dependent RNA helicase SUPV3L1/SUV3
VTGEERRIVDPAGEPAPHVACTVEMTSVTTPCELFANANFLLTHLEF